MKPAEINKPVLYGAISLLGLILGLSLILSNEPPTANTKSSTASLSHWQPIGHFETARRAFAASTNDKHVYVIGGIDTHDRYLSSVEFAPILADGKLGEWKQTSSLNEGRFYLSSVIIDNYIYAIGGANGPLGGDNIPSATVERAKILHNGELGPWEFQAYMTSPRRGLQSVSYSNHIYALGGYNGVFMKTVERAVVDRNGDIINWTEEDKSFVVDRYIHSAAIHNNRIYLIAGHVENQDILSYSDVESAIIQNDGSLSPWKIETTKLNTPRFIAAAASTGDFLYIAGGHDGANRLNSVEYAPIHHNGSVGTWTKNLSLKTKRSATKLLASGNNLYIFGGGGGENVLNTVERSQRLPNGKLIAIARNQQPTER